MKKLIALMFIASFGMALVGCGSKEGDATTPAPESGVKDKTPKADDAE